MRLLEFAYNLLLVEADHSVLPYDYCQPVALRRAFMLMSSNSLIHTTESDQGL
jgi:hypothetical protein